MDTLMIALGQLAFGFIVAGTLLLLVYIAYDFVVRALDGRRDIAWVPSQGAWQYYGDNDYNTDQFFTKIEEFRSDFS